MQLCGNRLALWLVPVVALGILPARILGADSGASTDQLGKKIDNLIWQDAAGKKTALYDLKDQKAIVLVFLSFECPMSTDYCPKLADLAKAYRERGVAFVGLCINDENTAQVAKFAKDFALPFPLYKDNQYRARDALKAKVTPEAFVLDKDFVLRYRGRIDNNYVARLKKVGQVTRHDLQQALDELLAGKPVSEPATQALGCAILREPVVKKPTSTATYYRDVLPILQNNCQSCHRPGEVGPFSLMTYQQAVNWASDIKSYTQDRKMPPWKPVEGVAFRDERKLSERDIATLAAWVDGGTPEGNPKDAPPPRQFVSGWQLGQPDLMLTAPRDFTLAASGKDMFRCYVLPTNLPEDKYVVAFEVRPGNRRVVHHTLNFIDTSGHARKLEKEEQAKAQKETDSGPGYSVAMGVGFLPTGGMGGWAPGQVPRGLPEGTGYLLPKGADVVIQVHYHRNGRVEKDRTSIGLYFAQKPVTRRYQGAILPGRFLMIPPGNDQFRVQGSMWIDQNCELHSIMPHMHMIGRQIKVTITPPDGKPQTLVAIKDWDYNWQETYFFQKPIHVQPGTRFDVQAIYDNSTKNPSNPNNPPKLVFFGEQTTNEMCYVFFGATSDQPGRIKQRREPLKREGAKPALSK